MQTLIVFTILSSLYIIFSEEIIEESLYNNGKSLRYLEGEDPFTAYDLVEPDNSENINGYLLDSEKASVLDKLIKSADDIEGKRMLRGFQQNDDAARFFKNIPYESIITKLPLQKELARKPWPGYYWAIRYGILSLRYCDDIKFNTMYGLDSENRTTTLTWQQSINKYSQPDSYNQALQQGQNLTEYVNYCLSPSEKYDMLVGDNNFTLTKHMKERGNFVLKTPTGDIDTWMGICHGWAIASYLDNMPVKPVTLTAADGVTKITFNRHDIMALSSAYWAQARYVSNFVGYRCSYRNMTQIPKDNETGIWLDYSCFGINPASFHLIITNQIGLLDKSFIFEPRIDQEIWNHPVYGYKIDYYNPITRFIRPIESARVNITDARAAAVTNRFLNFTLRNMVPGTEFIIGVRLRVDYIVENMPTTSNTVGDEMKHNITYLYFLELDKDMKAIGGEWRFNEHHPNFAWGPRENDEIISREDLRIRSFTGNVDELRTMLTASRTASARYSPLRAIMRYLVEQSSN